MKVKTKLQGLSSFFRMILVLAALDVADWDDGDNLDDYYPNEGGNTSGMTFSTPDAYKDKTLIMQAYVLFPWLWKLADTHSNHVQT